MITLRTIRRSGGSLVLRRVNQSVSWPWAASPIVRVCPLQGLGRVHYKPLDVVSSCATYEIPMGRDCLRCLRSSPLRVAQRRVPPADSGQALRRLEIGAGGPSPQARLARTGHPVVILGFRDSASATGDDVSSGSDSSTESSDDTQSGVSDGEQRPSHPQGTAAESGESDTGEGTTGPKLDVSGQTPPQEQTRELLNGCKDDFLFVVDSSGSCLRTSRD